jgi:hypothetical protein
MSERLIDLLPEGKPAPSRTSNKGLSQSERLAMFAPIIMTNCFYGQATPLADLATMAGYKRTNTAATTVGKGVGGKGGPRLHTLNGSVLACRENPGLIGQHLTEPAEIEMLKQLGVTKEQFAAAISELPSVGDDGELVAAVEELRNS